MKINWGTSIAIAIACFIGFIMYFVVTMLTGKDYEHDLVVEEYYKQEIGFQDQLDREQNSQNLSSNIEVDQTSEGILINFPKELDFSKIKGTAFMYRPSNKKLDFEVPLSLASQQLIVPAESLAGGRWNVVVDWTYEGESYFFKKEISY